jgi:DNA-binding NarL/FixJ family response regulator
VDADPLRVVLVGGHPVILGVARLGCEAAGGVRVDAEVGTVADAVRVVVAERPDVTVLDLDLPDGDGLEALRAIREAGFAGKVLVLSERTDGHVVLEATRLDAAGFLAKPDDLRRIGEAVRAIGAGERVVAPELDAAAVDEVGRRARRAREGAEVAATLTPREREVLALLAEGLTTQQMGRRLGIRARTVETHVGTLYRKLGVRTRVQAVARAAALGMLDIE